MPKPRVSARLFLFLPEEEELGREEANGTKQTFDRFQLFKLKTELKYSTI